MKWTAYYPDDGRGTYRKHIEKECSAMGDGWAHLDDIYAKQVVCFEHRGPKPTKYRVGICSKKPAD